MPCIKCPSGKYRIGRGQCVFLTLAQCQRALAAIHAVSAWFRGLL